MEEILLNDFCQMNQVDPWEMEFRLLHERSKQRIFAGEKSLEKLFSESDRTFLKSIGSKPIEMFDAADDVGRYGEPSLEDMLEIHRMRYDYFTKIQQRTFLKPIKEYRSKTAELGGIAWLPRAIDKVRAKLRGQLSDDLFYPCAGDRKFLKSIGMRAPDFFRLVRDATSDDKVVQVVKALGT